MSQEEIHVGDIKTRFQVTIKEKNKIVDISTATTKQIKFKKPISGTTVTKTATFLTDGTDGIIYYDTVDVNDLDESGTWEQQGYIAMPTWTGHSSKDEFEVYPNL